jgi:hypothetical protein
MQNLNLPTYPFKINKIGEKYFIFDEIRKKKVILTPEEWVRQHFIQFLIQKKGYKKSLIAVEKEIKINNLKKRFDILVFDNKGIPQVIVECKAPNIKITQDAFDQIARYNLKINSNYLVVTNGLTHYYSKIDFENQKYIFLKELPDYQK